MPKIKSLNRYIVESVQNNNRLNDLTIKRFNKGFTLIELLIVIAILGILATFIVANFAGAQARGRDARRKADHDALRKALVLFKNDQSAGTYPTTSQGTGVLAPTYIRVIPTNPTGGAYTYAATPPGCTNLVGNLCSGYTITVVLENTTDPDVSAPNASGARCAIASPVAGTLYTCNE